MQQEMQQRWVNPDDKYIGHGGNPENITGC